MTDDTIDSPLSMLAIRGIGSCRVCRRSRLRGESDGMVMRSCERRRFFAESIRQDGEVFECVVKAAYWNIHSFLQEAAWECAQTGGHKLSDNTMRRSERKGVKVFARAE